MVPNKYESICDKLADSMVHYSDITWVPWYLKLPSTLLFVLQFVQTYSKGNIKAHITGPLWGESTGDQLCRKRLYVETSSHQNCNIFCIRHVKFRLWDSCILCKNFFFFFVKNVRNGLWGMLCIPIALMFNYLLSYAGVPILHCFLINDNDTFLTSVLYFKISNDCVIQGKYSQK